LVATKPSQYDTDDQFDDSSQFSEIDDSMHGFKIEESPIGKRHGDQDVIHPTNSSLENEVQNLIGPSQSKLQNHASSHSQHNRSKSPIGYESNQTLSEPQMLKKTQSNNAGSQGPIVPLLDLTKLKQP
jgi:hypothetical protein